MQYNYDHCNPPPAKRRCECPCPTDDDLNEIIPFDTNQINEILKPLSTPKPPIDFIEQMLKVPDDQEIINDKFGEKTTSSECPVCSLPPPCPVCLPPMSCPPPPPCPMCPVCPVCPTCPSSLCPPLQPPPPPPLEDPPIENPNPPNPNPPNCSCPAIPTGPIRLDLPKQYTPDCGILTTDCMLNRMGQGVRPDRTANQPGNLGHDPRGMRFGFDGSRMPTEEDWAASTWDGVPFENGKWREKPIPPGGNIARWREVLAWLAPRGRPMIRGMHDLYYNTVPLPFADKFNPTTQEIDAWNIIALNHVRALLGEPKLIGYDATLMLEVKWASEMHHGTVWHEKYGDQCVTGNSHCGADFQPDSEDRLKAIACPPYNSDYEKYPELKDYHIFTPSQPKNRGTGDGNASTEARVPWSLRLATMVVSWIATEGWSGHAGPYLTRRWVGMHWSCNYGGQSDMGGVGVHTQWI